MCCVRLARTETRARRRPVHLALFFGLLFHVNQNVSLCKARP